MLLWYLVESEALQASTVSVLYSPPLRYRLLSGQVPSEEATLERHIYHSSRRHRYDGSRSFLKSFVELFVARIGDEDEKEEQLVEVENPQADFDRLSLSGVRYGSVFDSLNVLYPPMDLEKRIAVSRSDGYWSFINSGKDPPKQLTFGEFDLYFFAELLDRVLDHYNEWQDVKLSTWNEKVFTDIGSGTGRLVLAAAALHPWKLCRGVEVLEGIHNVAVETLEKCRHEINVSTPGERVNGVPKDSKEVNGNGTAAWKEFRTSFGSAQHANIREWLGDLRRQYEDTSTAPSKDLRDESDDKGAIFDSDENSPKEAEEDKDESRNLYTLPPGHEAHESGEIMYLAPIQFSCGSFEDPYEYFGDSDLIFVFSSCMSDMMSSLGKACGRQCKPGTIIITTDYSLPLSGDIDPLEDDDDMPYGSYRLELLESIDGWCWLTGGQSTAHIHRVVSSLWEEGTGPWQRPVISLEEQAYRIVKAYEAGKLTDTNKFLRDVRNTMIFAGLPESWLPSLDDD